MYKYTINVKGIFSRDLTSTANNKEEIEQATGMTISGGTWLAIEKGKKGIVEDETYVLVIEKIK